MGSFDCGSVETLEHLSEEMCPFLKMSFLLWLPTCYSAYKRVK